jgi:hypothetical protein
VAIKLLPAELTADEQFVTRFEREAKTLARLQHPGIVSIFDFGHTTDGHLYFVMEYVEGTDLQRILQGPGLEPGQALELITQICEALHAAHCQGVIHRDIKPANILITKDGRVKLADFGLARPDREDHGNITLSNVALGTPDYMAPEQRQGQTDLRADIYALGVMLYEMLTGQLPRGAWAPPSRKVTVDVRIDEVVLKALQLEPDRRYQQASEMKTDVDSIRSGPPIVPAPKAAPRRWMAWTVLVVVIALATAAAFWFAGQSRPVSANGKTGEPAAKGPVFEPTAWGLSGIPKTTFPPEPPLTPGEKMLKKTSIADDGYGMAKTIYSPARSKMGMIVRWSVSPAFMEDWQRGVANENTVFEWVQIPAERRENTITWMEGAPLWYSTDANVAEDVFLLRILAAGDTPIISIGRMYGPVLEKAQETDDSYSVTYGLYLAEERMGFLKIEIRAVPLDEIRARYPGIHETAPNGNDIAQLYIDGKTVNYKKGPHYLGGMLDDSGAPVPEISSAPAAKAKGEAAKSATEPAPLAPGEAKLKETRIPANEYGLSKFIYTPARSDLGLVVRYTAIPAIMRKAVRREYTEDTVTEWVFKRMGDDANFIQIMQGQPMWHEGETDENDDGIFMLGMTLGAKNNLLRFDKFPGMSMETETRKDAEGRINGYVLTYKGYPAGLDFDMREKAKPETQLKIEITALPIEEITAKYPKLKSPNLHSTRTIDERPASGVAEESVAEPAASPAQIAGLSSVGPAATPHAVSPPTSLEGALFEYRWDYVTEKPTHTFSHSLFFQPDGFAYSIGRSQQWRFTWKKTGPHALRLERERDTLDLTFDESFERFTGKSSNDWTAAGRRSRLRTPRDVEMLGNNIRKLSGASPTIPNPKPTP